MKRARLLTAADEARLARRIERGELAAKDELVTANLGLVHALARRPPLSQPETVLRVADLEMDLLKRTVKRASRRIDLQPQEFKLLEYLMRNAGRVVTRTMLLEKVWDFHFDPKTSVVETHMSRLRAKVDRGFGSELIHTVRGAGYCLRGGAGFARDGRSPKGGADGGSE